MSRQETRYVTIAGNATAAQELDLVAGTGITLTPVVVGRKTTLTMAASGTSVTDGDRGDVTISGSGSTYTIDAGVVTLAKMADLATDRIIGRDTAGTGVPESLTVTGGLEFTGSGGIQRSALSGDATAPAGSNTVTIANFTGDSGAGGVHGFVPAPAAGDAAAGKVLHADGTWTVPVTAGRTYYLDPSNASDLATYYTALTAPSTAVESTLSVAATGTTDNLLAAFATDPGVPGATLIPPGSAGRHFHVETGANNEIARLLVEVYTCLADGTSETLIRSGYSPSFYGATSQELLFSFEDATGYTITATQRIVYKVYAARVSGPATCNITVYFNGASRASYVTSTILSPATGTTDHAASSNLVWTSSGHTGTASRLAGFDGGGAAAYYQIGVDVQAYDSDLSTIAGLTVARGSLIVGSAAPAWSALALGTSGQVLQSNGTDAIWGSVGGSMFGSILTTEEDMMVRRGGVVTRLPVGVEGQALRIVSGLVTWGYILMATVATQELSEIGTVGTTNSTRAGSIGQEGTIV